MKIEDIKKEYSQFPHITKVYVKGGEVFLTPVHGAKIVDLTEDVKKSKGAADSDVKQPKTEKND